MCTVVFIPVNSSVYFGSLRDESPNRPLAIAPEIYKRNEIEFLAPKDPMAGGTWIGANNSGNTIILLNGGFENHERKNYYRKSRGLIVKELLALKQPVIEWNLINLEDIEPFTLVVWSCNKLFQLVWDGQHRTQISLDANEAHIWSSSTLYKKEVRAYRQQLFKEWIATKPAINSLSLFNFFTSFGNNENGFVINRNNIIKTLSFSFIELADNAKVSMSYHDFLNDSHINKILILNSELNTYNL